MDKKSLTKSEIENKLIEIMKNTEFFSLNLNKGNLNAKSSLIKDLALDSIQLLEYLVAVESEFQLNLDYEDLSIEVFDSFSVLAEYLYNKASSSV